MKDMSGGVDAATGRTHIIEEKLDARMKKARKSHILDLSDYADKSSLKFDFVEVPVEVYQTFKMSKLRELWLSNNELASLESSIRVLHNLETLAVDGNQADLEDSSHARFFLRAPLLIATKPVLIGVTERLAPQLLHCMK